MSDLNKGYVAAAALLLFAFVGYVGYTSMQPAGGSYQDVAPDRAQAIINEQEPVVLDVRTVQEYQTEHLQGAVNIPVERPNELKDRYTELPKDQPIVVYCRTGRRSANAAQFLSEKGFQQVYNVRGGIQAWKAQGLSTFTDTAATGPSPRSARPLAPPA